MGKYIFVKSLALLMVLSEAKCLGLFVAVSKDEKSEKALPDYKFANKPDVAAIIEEFIKENGTDDKALDGNRWDNFDKDNFWNYKKDDTIATSNYTVISKIIEAGYGANLLNIFKDNNTNRKLFVFRKNDEIMKIKSEQDKINRDNWLARQAENKEI
jgi:hypothetical protein